MMTAVVNKLKEENLDRSFHYESISEKDLQKLRKPESFNLMNPRELQEKVFFDIVLCLGRRGQEGLRKLHKNSFTILVDDSGLEFAEMTYHEKTKNHRTVDGQQGKPRIYATGLESCPLRSLKIYLSRLDKDTSDFFVKQKCSKDFHPEFDNIWFTSKPLGRNSIGGMMKAISKRLSLSMIYTNHCIRATCVTELSANGLEARQIMRVTGHKCESSLRSYEKDNTVSQKRRISSILSGNSVTVNRSIVQSTTSTLAFSETQTQREETHHELIAPSTMTTAQTGRMTFSNNTNCTFNIYTQK